MAPQERASRTCFDSSMMLVESLGLSNMAGGLVFADVIFEIDVIAQAVYPLTTLLLCGSVLNRRLTEDASMTPFRPFTNSPEELTNFAYTYSAPIFVSAQPDETFCNRDVTLASWW